MRRGTATANHRTSQGVNVRFHSAARIPSAAATVQPQWARAEHGYAATADAAFSSAAGCAVDQSRERRLSVWNPRARQTAFGRESLLTWQIHRRRRIPARDRSKGSLYGQDFPRAVRRARCGVR